MVVDIHILTLYTTHISDNGILCSTVSAAPSATSASKCTPSSTIQRINKHRVEDLEVSFSFAHDVRSAAATDDLAHSGNYSTLASGMKAIAGSEVFPSPEAFVDGVCSVYASQYLVLESAFMAHWTAASKICLESCEGRKPQSSQTDVIRARYAWP